MKDVREMVKEEREEGSRKEAGRRLRASTPGKHYEPMLFLPVLQ